MNGDVLLITYDYTKGIYELHSQIEKYDEECSIDFQKLIRISDEKVNPSNICNGDTFNLFMDNTLNISFTHDQYYYISCNYSKNNIHKYEIHTLFVNNKFNIEFVYDPIMSLFADTNTCGWDEDYDDKEVFIITQNTVWHPSLIMCVRSNKNKFPKSHPIIDELDVRFKMHRVITEFNDSCKVDLYYEHEFEFENY